MSERKPVWMPGEFVDPAWRAENFPWHADHAKLTEFGAVLIQVGEFGCLAELQGFYEKPWKWQPEFDSWTENGQPVDMSHSNWQDWITWLEQR